MFSRLDGNLAAFPVGKAPPPFGRKTGREGSRGKSALGHYARVFSGTQGKSAKRKYVKSLNFFFRHGKISFSLEIVQEFSVLRIFPLESGGLVRFDLLLKSFVAVQRFAGRFNGFAMKKYKNQFPGGGGRKVARP